MRGALSDTSYKKDPTNYVTHAGNLYFLRKKSALNMSMEYPVTSAKTKLLKATKLAFGKDKSKFNCQENVGKSIWLVLTAVNFLKFLDAQMLLLKHLPPRKLSGSLY